MTCPRRPCTAAPATAGGPQKSPRNVVFTFNNYTDAHVEALQDPDRLEEYNVSYIIAARECVSTPHLQGYVEFSKAMRWAQVQDFFFKKAHLSAAFADQAHNRAYITKGEQTKEEWKAHGAAGPNHGKNLDMAFEIGTPKHQGKRNDINKLTTAIKEGATVHDVARDFPEMMLRMPNGISKLCAMQLVPRKRSDPPPKVFVHFGPTATGKTKGVYDFHDAMTPQGGDNVCLLSADLLSKGWHDGYVGQKVVCLDEYRGQCTFAHLLQLTDRYPITVNVKGATVPWNVDYIHMTSPVHPTLWYASKLESNDGSLEQLRRRITSVYYHYHIDEEPLDLTDVPWKFFVDAKRALRLIDLQHLECVKKEVEAAFEKYPDLNAGAFADRDSDPADESGFQFPQESSDVFGNTF
jgi:hypothetical protein